MFGEVARRIVAWDRTAFLAINHGLKNAVLDRVVPPLTDLGLLHVQVLVVLLLAVWLGWRTGEVRRGSAWRDSRRAVHLRRAWIGPVLTAAVLSGLTATVIKNTTQRDRPWWFYLHEHRAGRQMDAQVLTVPGRRPVRVRGFPSGHTATTSAIATVLTWLAIRRRRGIWLVMGVWMLAGLIGLSRIYMADHWPLDVMGGAVVGIVCGWLAVPLCRAWAQRDRRVKVETG